MIFCFALLSSGFQAQAAPQIQVSGPESVSLGQSVQLKASTSGGIQEDYFWYVSSWFGEQRPFSLGDNGTVTGQALGKGTISVMGLSSAAAKTFEFYTDSGKELTLLMSMNQIFTDQGIGMEIDCEVMEEPEPGTKLAAGVMVDEQFYFLPGLTADLEWFSQDLKQGKHEIIQFSVDALPYNTYTFAAAAFDQDMQIISNVAVQEFKGGYRGF